MIDTDVLADRHVAAIRAMIAEADGPPERVTLPTFADAAALERWHPEMTLQEHAALVAAVTLRLAALGIEVERYAVTIAAYDRWRGGRADSPENRSRFVGERGVAHPWRLGLKLGGAPKPGRSGESSIGWSVFDTDGWRFARAGTTKLDP